MTVAEATPELDLPAHDRAFLGHPKGLGYLAFVEGCERFSYYSMQTLLVLYMVKYLLLPENITGVIGLQWLQGAAYGGKEGQPLASAIFGDYSSLVYLTPIAGGLIADRWLGRRATLLAGAVVMACSRWWSASGCSRAISPARWVSCTAPRTCAGLWPSRSSTSRSTSA